MPTSQSASLRDTAASASGSISASLRRFANAVRMESGVMLWSHRRWIGCFAAVARMMLRKMSSPSRPASHALMIAPTSLRLISFLITASRGALFSIGFRSKYSGRLGRFSSFHFPRASLPSGAAISSRCPTALEITYLSFS